MKPLTQDALLRRRCQRILADQRRRAKKDGWTIDYDVDLLVASVTLCTQCVYCKVPVGFDFQFDHRQPIARGGEHRWANLAVCCKGCNVRKGQLSDTEYRQLLALIGSWLPVAQEDIRRRLTAGNLLYARSRRKKG